MPRSRLVLLALLAACPLALPAAAGAQTTREVHVDATLEFSYTTTWSKPAHRGFADCAKSVWDESKGEESMTFKSRRPTRLVFRVLGQNGAISPSLVDGVPASMLVPLAGPHVRKRTGRVWHGPGLGDCTAAPYDQRFKGDCGTRLPQYEVLFAWDGRELRSAMGGDQSVEQRDRDLWDFENCPVDYPTGAPGESWRLRERKLPISKVLGQRSFGVDDSQTWTQPTTPGARPFTSTTKLTWKATFTRVGKVATTPSPAAPPKKRGGKPRKKGRRG